MEIILMRHGKPDLSLWSWVSPSEMQDWIHAYNHAGLCRIDPPAAGVALAAGAGVIASSTLRRSVDSAKRLRPGETLLSDHLFCEITLPHSGWRFPRLPFYVWAALFRIGWFCGFANRAESLRVAAARADLAAQRLVTLAQKHGSVLLVGHGIMNQMIATHLRAMGWTGQPRTSTGYWISSTYKAGAAQ
jgi:hypothetical protein